ncbi:tyrosine-type recombinase/integrase [Leptothoe sp. EHU-05/26/07-4]
MKRYSKGEVGVKNRQGRYVLTFTCPTHHKRREIATGYPAKREFLTRARAKAAIIQTDLGTANYDPTLAKYRKPTKTARNEVVLESLSTFELLDRYQAHRVSLGKLQAITIHNRWNPLRQHMQRSKLFENLECKKLSTNLIQKFTDYLANQGLRKKSIRGYLSVLRGLSAYLNKLGVIDIDICAHVEIKTKYTSRPAQVKRPFNRDEVDAILTVAKEHARFNHYYLFILCLFSWGLRVSELIGLRWCDINFQTSQVTVGSSLSKVDTYHRKRKETKTGSVRTLSITPKLLQQFLDSRPQDYLSSDLVFKTVRGKVINDGNFRLKVWKPLLKQTCVEYRSPHTCRHTFASLGIEEYGWTDYQAAQHLGHKDTRMIQQVYGHAITPGTMPEI